MLLSDYFMGTAFDAYTYFGAHPGPLGVMFRVYAPHASRVAVIGDFNNWEDHYLGKDEWGIFSDIVPYAEPGQKYKYRIYQSDGSVVDKTDPYAFGMELRPNSASYIVDMFSFKYEDEEWMKNRTRNHDSAMNIYEIHMGSWKKPGPAQEDWYNYRELAPLLIDYLKENHYTHVEVMPLAEHPFDGSWGYQQTGFYSPTARYGSADDLKFFVNELHKAGIGIIMDYVPVHFATDGYSLIRFDGTPIYEYDNENGYSEWGSCNFNFYKGEVRSFLQSAAHYWLEEYHFDGLRMDAISNVIYWAGNSNRGVNEAGLQFLKEMNAGIHSLHPTAMVIAEDSSAYAKVTAAVQYDGLGFDYKWDMGWMNDTLRYFKLAPWERCDHYHMLTFSMMYFYSELFIMTFSHDEVVHGKATIMQKMWGDYDQKFAQARLLFTYMYTHPGKKLNFMGNEIGQLREWDETREQDWFLLKYPNHDAFYHYMKELNRIYVENPALYSGDYNGENFRWLQVQGEKDCVYCYQRTCGKNVIVTAFNTQDIPHNNYSFRIPENMVLTQILNSDWNEFGGSTPHPQRRKKYRSDNNMLTIDLPPYGAVVYEAEIVKEKKKKTKKKDEEVKTGKKEKAASKAGKAEKADKEVKAEKAEKTVKAEKAEKAEKKASKKSAGKAGKKTEAEKSEKAEKKSGKSSRSSKSSKADNQVVFHNREDYMGD